MGWITGLQTKAIAALATLLGLVVMFITVWFKGKNQGTAEVNVENTERLLTDIETKNEITSDIAKDIIASDRESRINSL